MSKRGFPISISNSNLKTIRLLLPIILCLAFFPFDKVSGMVLPMNRKGTSAKVHPLKTSDDFVDIDHTNKDDPYANPNPTAQYLIPADQLHILPSTQARIYSGLDTEHQNRNPNGPSSEWFQNRIIWTDDGVEEDDAHEETRSISDVVLDLETENLIDDHLSTGNSGGLLSLLYNKDGNSSNRKNSGHIGFRDLLNSAVEVDRILKSASEDIDSDTESDTNQSTERYRRRGDQTAQSNRTSSSLRSSTSGGSFWEWTQQNRSQNKTKRNRPTLLLKPKRREKRQVTVESSKDLTEVCGNVVDKDSNPATWCYDCTSTTNDREPTCDSRYWKYTRHSQKLNVRTICPANRGDFCMKTVDRKLGMRRTKRGCFKGPMRVPGPQGEAVNVSQEGCFTYVQDGYLTTSCFCKNNLCNAAQPHASSGLGSLISMLVLGITFGLYAIAFAFLQHGT